MKLSTLLALSALSVVCVHANNDATQLAFESHAMLEKADSSADKVIAAMDNVAQAIAAADDKLQSIIRDAKAGVRKQQHQHSPDATVKADFVALSRKAVKAASSPGGFDWAQFVPNKNGMGKPQSKLASAGESPDSSASPQSSSSPEKTQGGYDWSKWAPKDTSGGSFNKAPSGVLIAKSLQMTPETVAMEAASMSEQAASAAEALAQKLKEAANKLQIASEKLKAKAAEARESMGSSDDVDSVETSTSTSVNLRSPVVHESASSSVVPTVLGLVIVGGVAAGVMVHRRNRNSYERL